MEHTTQYKKSLQRRMGAILSYCYLLIATIVNFLYVPILLKAMGKSEYGIYQLIASMVSYLTIMQSTLSSTTIRFYSRSIAENDENAMNRVLYTSRFIFRGISLIIIIVGAIFYFLLEPFYKSSLNTQELIHAKQVFIILLIQIFVEVNACLYNAIIHSKERFIFIKILSIITTIINPIILLLIINKAPYAMTVALVHLMISISFYFVRSLYCKKQLKISINKTNYNKKLFKEMTVFSATLLLAVIADQLFWKTDQIILTKICGVATVAIYSIGATIYMNFISLSSAINNVFLPRITELVVQRDNTSINKLFLKIGRYQYLLLSLVLSGFILFGREFIVLWVGAEYLEVYIIVLLIIVPLTPDLCEGIGISVLQARNTYSIRAYLYLTMAVINVAMTIILSKIYGGIGAAMATGISIIVGSLLALNIYYCVYEKLPIIRLLFQMINSSKVYLALIPFGMMLNKVIRNYSYINLFIKVITYSLAYFLAIYILEFSKNEKRQIKEVVLRKR